MKEERIKLDAVVVGGGASGLAAACTMATEGLQVGVLERGSFCGAKNVSGLLYTTVLSEILPDYLDSAPLERPVSRRSITFLDNEAFWSVSFGADAWSEQPFNYTHVVYRAQFDRWFAEKAEAIGATLLEGMVVDGLIYEGNGPEKRPVGVRVRDDEPLYADVIILADGANCVVTDAAIREMGLRRGQKEQTWALGVKQIFALSREKIEDRFNLEPHEGCAIDFIGVPFSGLIGGGFVYTAKETIAVGFAGRTECFVRERIKPADVMDAFCQHPAVRKYLHGGELVEYSAHMIPESGYHAIPDLAANSLMIVGDAAGLVNMSLYHEGGNHAMASGRAAGRAAVDAKKKGDFSRNGLQGYVASLNETFVLRDLARYREVPEILDSIPELFSLYPARLCSLLIDFFTMSQRTKAETQKAAIRRFLAGLPKVRSLHNLWKARRLI